MNLKLSKIKRLLLLLLVSVLSHSMLAVDKYEVKVSDIKNQQEVVSGVVTDDSDLPLPGVNIFIKGTNKGTSTDFDGKYSIKAKKGDILVFSFVGFETKEIVVQSNVINLQMTPSQGTLDEVVVTALGIKREQKKIGYATQEIKTKTIEEVSAVPNVGNLFTGQVAGLTVNNPTGLFQAPEFTLRGKKPLIVIDGIPIETDFYDVSPNNIANINVLKGTAASALYGLRGKDGAIIITTKGAKKEGLSVELSHNTMVSAGFSVFPETQTQYGSGSKGKYEFWDGKDGGISDGDMTWGPKFVPNLKVKQWNSPIYDKVTGATIPWWGDVWGTKYDDRSRYSRVPIPWKYHNNLKNFLQASYISSTNLSVGYRGEKGSYLFSANFKDHKGRVPTSELKTGGVSFKSSLEIAKGLTLDSKLAYNKVYSPSYPRHGYGPKNHMYTILIWMGDDVNGNDLENHLYVPGQEGFRQANYNYAWYNNPYFSTKEFNQTFDSDLINGLLQLKLDVTEELSFKTRVSLMNRTVFEDTETPKTYLNYGRSDGDYETMDRNKIDVNLDFMVNYDKSFNENFGINFNFGLSSFYQREREQYNGTDGLIVPEVYSLNNSKGTLKATNKLKKRAIESVFGSFEFDFYNSVFLTLTGRNDWSSTLPEENRSFFYPSASLSTVVSNLVDMPEFINYLKVYGSWARVSSDLDPYQLELYYKKPRNGTFKENQKLTYPKELLNPNIKPETSTTTEFGISSSLLKNRLSFNFTYFNTVDKNQIIKLPISRASGFKNRKVNGNEFTTKGYEFVISGKPIVNDNFSWNASANISTKVKRITEIYGNESRFGNLSLNERVDNYYSTAWKRTADGRLILSESGMPIKDEFKQNFGHLDPDFIVGLQNNFKYKNFGLSIGIDGAFGGVFRSTTIEKMWWGGKHPNSVEYRDKEYETGKPAYLPNGVNIVSGELKRDIYGNVLSDTRKYKKHTKVVNWQDWSQTYPYRGRVTQKQDKKFANIMDRTFLKLRSVSLKYDLSEAMKKTGLSYFDISLSGYNLYTWKKADIVDPDFGDDENLQDPSTRYIGIGINAKF